MNWLIVGLGAFALASAASAFLLIRKAVVRPRTGALSERAWVALLHTTIGAVFILLRWNADTGFMFFSREVGIAIFVVCIIGILSESPTWLVLYATNRLR